jgi:hypothetical protein
MKSYLSERAGCIYRQTAGSWNVLDTLSDVIICNHLSATRRFCHVPEPSMGFHDVPVNQSVPTEANRGLTPYNRPKATAFTVPLKALCCRLQRLQHIHVLCYHHPVSSSEAVRLHPRLRNRLLVAATLSSRVLISHSPYMVKGVCVNSRLQLKSALKA